MSKRDYYDVLGVEKNADDKAIKAAFRKLAMANHPDRNQGDNAAEDRFREANEAYDILKDPQKRAAYDRMGHAAFDQSAGGGVALAALALVAVAFLIFSIRCFPNFPVAVAGGSAIRAAMIFAMICQSRLKMPLPDCSRIFQSRYRLNVMAV